MVASSAWKDTSLQYLDKEGVIRKVSLPLILVRIQGQRYAVTSGLHHRKLGVTCKAMLGLDRTHVTKLGEANRNPSPGRHPNGILMTVRSDFAKSIGRQLLS